MSPLITRQDEDTVAVLWMHDEAGHNTLSEAFVEQLETQLAAVAADHQVKVCLLRGMTDVFCGGGNQQVLHDLASGRVSASDLLLSRTVLDLPIPTIAAMEGHAVGGGLTLALCCDIVLMAREARYGCSFMNMGFTPGMGTTRLLQLAVGEYLAAEMMYGGQFFRGTHFAGCSAINYVLPRDQVLPKALSVAQRIAEKPRHALELLKRSLSLRKRALFEEARALEPTMHELCFARPETATLIEENYAPALDKPAGDGDTR